MTPEQRAQIRALLRNFDTWLEENGQYEDDAGAERIEAERGQIAESLIVLDGDG